LRIATATTAYERGSSVTTRVNASEVRAAIDRRTCAMSALASSSCIAVESCSYGCFGKLESISVTRRRAITAATRPGAATHTRCAHPVCSATLTTHGAPLITSIFSASYHAPDAEFQWLLSPLRDISNESAMSGRGHE
jgi:hypothetical protein